MSSVRHGNLRRLRPQATREKKFKRVAKIMSSAWSFVRGGGPRLRQTLLLIIIIIYLMCGSVFSCGQLFRTMWLVKPTVQIALFHGLMYVKCWSWLRTFWLWAMWSSSLRMEGWCFFFTYKGSPSSSLIHMNRLILFCHSEGNRSGQW